LSLLESVIVWGGIYLYALDSILLLTAFVFNKERLLVWAGRVLIPAFVVHTFEFGFRWYSTGYFPGNGEYENGLVAGWFAMAFTVYFFYRRKSLRGVALVTVPATLLMLGYGIMIDPVVLPVAASFKSNWLIIHVFFAQISYGAYAIACGLGVIYILKDNRQRKGGEVGIYERFPALPVVEEYMFKFVVYGFITDAVMIAAGSIWAKELWGAYWGWDPVEVWSLVSWLVYGLAIHLRVTMGWRGRKLAWLMIFAIITVVITYWGVDIVVKGSHRMFGVQRSG